jgi:hypothetical protein
MLELRITYMCIYTIERLTNVSRDNELMLNRCPSWVVLAIRSCWLEIGEGGEGSREQFKIRGL